MTNIEHLMLSMCFGMNLGWLLGSVIVLFLDILKHIIDKHKSSK